MSTKDLFTELPFTYEEKIRSRGLVAFHELALALEKGLDDLSSDDCYSLTRTPNSIVIHKAGEPTDVLDISYDPDTCSIDVQGLRQGEGEKQRRKSRLNLTDDLKVGFVFQGITCLPSDMATRVDQLDVPPISPLSNSRTLNPRIAASRAIPAPLIPAPMMITSKMIDAVFFAIRSVMRELSVLVQFAVNRSAADLRGCTQIRRLFTKLGYSIVSDSRVSALIRGKKTGLPPANAGGSDKCHPLTARSSDKCHPLTQVVLTRASASKYCQST